MTTVVHEYFIEAPEESYKETQEFIDEVEKVFRSRAESFESSLDHSNISGGRVNVDTFKFWTMEENDVEDLIVVGGASAAQSPVGAGAGLCDAVRQLPVGHPADTDHLLLRHRPDVGRAAASARPISGGRVIRGRPPAESACCTPDSAAIDGAAR